MDAEAIDKVLSLAPPTVLKVGDLSYASKAITPVMAPRDSAEEVITLTGVVDLMSAHVNGLNWSKSYIHVESPKRVTVSELECDEWGRRQVHIVCALPEYGRFRFDEYLSQERFIIGLQAFFDREKSTDMQSILAIVGKLKAEAVSEADDDGVTQVVTVRKGVVLNEKATVKKIVWLRPYRTFREITQPESAFIFRLRSNEGEVPSMGLFAADADMWQAEAMQSIKAYLGSRLLGVEIIA